VAPPSFTALKRSPVAHQATTPATTGIRYCKGAVRATPRCSLTQPQTNHPRNADTSDAHYSRPQCSAVIAAQGAVQALAAQTSTTRGLPAMVAQAITVTPPWRWMSGLDITV